MAAPTWVCCLLVVAIALTLTACSRDESPPSEQPVAKARAMLEGSAAVKVKAVDASSAALFGLSVSSSGSLALIGAPGDLSSAGSVYSVALPIATGASAIVKLRGGDSVAGDLFGAAVALDGDRAIVGARNANTGRGAVYLFERQSDAWTAPPTRLNAHDAVANDLLGAAVSLSGSRALAGAPNHNSGAAASGAVYVFERQTDGRWTETLLSSLPLHGDTVANDQFGSSVALSGERALVGAIGNDAGATDAGAAYIFDRQADGSWLRSQKIQASDPVSSGQFGIAVALAGDRALIGAVGARQSSVTTGAAYLFERQASGIWVQRAKIVGNVATNDQFGSAVALVGDRALIGAKGPSRAPTTPGSAYLFQRDAAGTWEFIERLVANDSSAGAYFGNSVALTLGSVLVGAPQQGTSSEGLNSGALYSFALLGSLGEVCSLATDCESGFCTNSVCCEGTCDDSNSCTNDGCAATGHCTHTASPNGSPCNDGSLCTQIDACDAGVCAGTNPVACTALDQCHVAGICNPYSGVCTQPNASDGTRCDDNNACTQLDSCRAGACVGTARVCAPVDQCHLQGTCNQVSGVCEYPAMNDGSRCNDGNACTQLDACLAGSCVGSNPVICTALDQCHVTGVCDSTTGLCSNPTAPNGIGCNDGNACTQSDVCLAGSCDGGDSVTCAALDQCHVAGACDAATGLCSNPTAPNGIGCNDGNACTQSDLCLAGSCVGSSPVICTALDQCHVAGACDSATGLCSNPTAPNGIGCNDGNACTQSDVCLAGSCVGGNLVICTALDQCHVTGACDSATGLCPNPTAPNGIGCNDGNACTQADVCLAGSCVGGNSVICTALDQCHVAGACDSSTGLCSNPTAPNGTGCNDGNGCTQSDACLAGGCVGGNSVICTALDQCHVAGTCDSATGLCSNPTAPNGTGCNDGNGCTQSDTCLAGGCVGGNSVICTALDQCHVAGVCNSTTGLCSNPTAPNGIGCNDGNACTQSDVCLSGSCVGGNPVICTALDQCHVAGVCDSARGLCSNPSASNGIGCNDNNACTAQDNCQAGQCISGPARNCDDADPCTADACTPSSGCTHQIVDRDGDGTPDCSDGCPNDPGKTSPGLCGCGKPDGTPVVTVPPNVATVACRESETVAVGQAAAVDACGTSRPVSGYLILSNDLSVQPPIAVTAGQVALGVGTHVIQWTGPSGSGIPPVTQTVVVGSNVQVRESFVLGDRSRLRDARSGYAVMLNSGTGAARAGYDSFVGGIYSVGSVSVMDRATVQGNVISGTSLDVSRSAVVTGSAQVRTVRLPELPPLNDFEPSGSNVTVNSGQSRTLTPGYYLTVTVNSGGTLELQTGDYHFRDLLIYASATPRVTNAVNLFVSRQLTFQSQFKVSDGTLAQTSLGFLGNTLNMEAPFKGRLLAPNAAVTLGTGSGLTFTGAFFARALEVRPDSVLVCALL